MERKYIEYFEGVFDSTVTEKIQPENWPYVAYSTEEGVVYTVIPEEPTSAYQMIDLGLPSGLKWADRNIGAETPQDSGLYFDWGNIDGHTVDENGNVIDGYSFDRDTYATTLGGQYTGNELDAERDAATVNMGSDWRMPTKDEMVELIQNTDHYYIGENGNVVAGPFTHETSSSNKGLNGSKLYSICFVKKSEAFEYDNRTNFIEFPFAGYCNDSLLCYKGVNVSVWSSSLGFGSVDTAYSFGFSSYGYLNSDISTYRYGGFSVRGVRA